jgi:CelD/BcsL family acetyltransferase involved in cellulose biosynthesis
MSVPLPHPAQCGLEVRRLQHDVKSITDLDAFRALRREWDQLIAAAHTYSFCITYSYCELAASRVWAAGGIVNVIRVYDERGLCALWPVAIQRKGLFRVAKALSCGADEEYGGPLVRDETNLEVMALLMRATAEIRADVLRIRFVVRESALYQALNSRPQSWFLPIVPKGLRDDVPGYLINLRQYPRWDDFAATRSKSLFSDSRRNLKRLNAKGQTEFGWCKTAEDAEAILTWLFATKRRWAESRQFDTKYLMGDEVRDFFIELARKTDLLTTPLVTFLRVDGVPVAGSINLVGQAYFEGFITTYDDAFSACTPGNLMHEYCMKWAYENGRDFDLRPVFTPYKARWANRETSHSTISIFLTIRGRLAEFALLAGYWARVKGRLRESLARRRAGK